MTLSRAIDIREFASVDGVSRKTALSLKGSTMPGGELNGLSQTRHLTDDGYLRIELG